MFVPRSIPQFISLLRTYWSWFLGAGVLCFTAVLAFYALPAIQTQNDVLERQIRSLQRQQRALAAASPLRQPQDFDAHLGAFGSLPALVNDLQAQAVKYKLILSDATYKPIDGAAGTDLGRMEIGVHLKGTYVPLKKMLAALFKLHEGLALQSLSVQRTRSTDSILDIDLRFNFFYRKSA